MRNSCILVLLVAFSFASTARGETNGFTPPPIEIPEGYTLEIAAAPPLVKYPMLACFDDRGRLFIAESDGQNPTSKEEILQNPSRFIRLLEDTDDDGTFDKSTIFADKMTMPEGGVWLDGALYVISPPYLWRLEDTDDDGVADKREKLLGSMEFDGRANQHGPFLGPNGRLYFSGGIFGYDLVGTDGSQVEKSSTGSVFSCRPDGTDVRVDGQGPLNPVEVAFSPEGEMFSTAAIFDSTDGRHDALIHWLYGGVTTKIYGGPLLLKETGHRLPALSRWGQVAPAGLMRYRGNAFGTDASNQLFACQFNSHRVVRTTIQRHGATYRSEDEDFLVSPSIDFHPTEVIEDADGSLLVFDTGSWVSGGGCPTSKISKPDIFGAIYRIRKKGAPRVDDPRGLELAKSLTTPEQWVAYLDDSRPAVRDRAIATLVRQGAAAVPALQSTLTGSDSAQRLRNAVWALSRIATPEAVAALRGALTIEDRSVRQAAVRSVGELADEKSVETLTQFVTDDELPVRRASATALGKIGRSEAIPALVRSLETAEDPFLQHALTYALIEIDNFEATQPHLASANTKVQQAVLIALDQMNSSRLSHDQVTKLLDSSDQQLRNTAIKVFTNHKDWADKIRVVVGDWLASPQLSGNERSLARAVLTGFSGTEGMQSLIATALSKKTTPLTTKVLILEALAASDLQAMPDSLHTPLANLLRSDESQLVEATVAAIWAKDSDSYDARLLQISRDVKRSAPLRLAALSIVARHDRPLDRDDFELLLSQFSDEVLPVDRLRAAEALAAARLTQQQTMAVADLLAVVGPLELPKLVSRFQRGVEPVVVNVDVQKKEDRSYRGLAAFDQDPRDRQAIWNTWHAATGAGMSQLRTSGGDHSALSLSPIEGSPLRPYVLYRFDKLMGDFVYNGDPDQKTEHQSNSSHFTIRGLRPFLKYDLYYYGSAYPKVVPRGARVTVTDEQGAASQNIHGAMLEERDYKAGVTHAVFSELTPREDGTIQVTFTASDDDTEGNFGIFNGLSIVTPAAEGGDDLALGLRLVAALDKSDALASVPHSQLKKLLDSFPSQVVQAARPLLKRSLARAEQQEAQLADLLPKLKGGDPRRGHDVFFGNKAVCHTCHRAAGQGAEVGPELTSIGTVRTHRDLAEAILYPNSTLVNGYSAFQVVTNAGQILEGVVSRESSDAVFLQMAGKPEVRISREDIDEMVPLPLSIMPQGLEKTVTTEELRDLIAYLMTLK